MAGKSIFSWLHFIDLHWGTVEQGGKRFVWKKRDRNKRDRGQRTEGQEKEGQRGRDQKTKDRSLKDSELLISVL